MLSFHLYHYVFVIYVMLAWVSHAVWFFKIKNVVLKCGRNILLISFLYIFNRSHFTCCFSRIPASDRFWFHEMRPDLLYMYTSVASVLLSNCLPIVQISGKGEQVRRIGHFVSEDISVIALCPQTKLYSTNTIFAPFRLQMWLLILDRQVQLSLA